jgi:hypothetical protein
MTVGVGFPTTFRVVASGAGPFTYQWQRRTGGVNFDIVGATKATYTTPALTMADNNSVYLVIVSNGFSTAVSNFAQVTMVTLPVGISGHPDANIVLAGDDLTLNVLAGGISPLSYQWKRNGSNLVDGTKTDGTVIAGARTAELTVNNISVAHAGVYVCAVTPPENPLTEVIEAVPLLTHPRAGLVTVVGNTLVRTPLMAGKAATLTVSIGVPALPPGAAISYKWFKDGDPVTLDTRITATGKTLKFKTLLAPDDTGIYTVEVTGPNGPITAIPNPAFPLDRAKDTVTFGTATVAANVADLEAYDLPPLLGNVQLPVGIVGGTYDYQIPTLGDERNAVVTYAASGLPAGLKIDSKTGRITGKPTKVTPGPTPAKPDLPDGQLVTITVSNSVKDGKSSVKKYLIVKPLPTNLAGTYAGPLPRHIGANYDGALPYDPTPFSDNNDLGLNGNMGGRFDLVVTATGSFTGKVTMGKMVSAFKGVLEVDVTEAQLPQATVTILRSKMTPLTLKIYIDTDTQKLAVDGEPLSSLSDGINTIYFHGWRNKWNDKLGPIALGYQGYYTVALDLTEAADKLNPVIPQGVGYLSLTVAAKGGTVKVAGKTADHQTITGSQFVGPDGEVLMYQAFYPIKMPAGFVGVPLGGSVLGTLRIDDLGTESPADNILDAGWTLSWLRPFDSNVKAYTYKAGFGPVSLTPLGGIYTPPTYTTTHLLNAVGTMDNAEVVFSGAGLPAIIDPSMTVSINTDPTKKDAVTVVKSDTKVSPNPNPANTAVKVTHKTGLFTGTFTLVDPDPRATLPPLFKPWPQVTRKVTYQGIIINIGSEQKGLGYFLLKSLPVDATETTEGTTPVTAPILSGKVEFQALPAVP